MQIKHFHFNFSYAYMEKKIEKTLIAIVTAISHYKDKTMLFV